MKIPGWASSAIWYSVYPLGACGAPIRGADEPGVHHRLGSLTSWLDHIVALGANGLALGPLWASSTHGYDIIDHDRIDRRLGDDADFDALVAACQARGIKVLLDGVFNHVSSEHAAVLMARSEGADSASGRLFRHDPSRPDGLSRFEGHDGLVEYDHTNPAVADAVAQTMVKWLRRGTNGWRLDAAYRVPAWFWADVIGRVKAEFPQALFVAEVLHGDYALLAGDFGVDSVTQYELWKAIWSSLRDLNPHELLWTLQRHAAGLAANPGGFLPWTFVGNHDVTRIATQVGPEKALLATAILATLPGMPAVYYGDEFGLTGLKEERVGGDDAIRPALPANPDSWQTSGPDSAEMWRQHQLLFGMRRRHPWLQWADLAIVRQSHQQLSYQLTPSEQMPALGQWLRVDLDVTGGQLCLGVTDPAGQVWASGH